MTKIIFGSSVVNVIGDNNPTSEAISVMVQKRQTRIQTKSLHARSNVNLSSWKNLMLTISETSFSKLSSEINSI